MDRITEFTITRIKMQGFKAFAQERESFSEVHHIFQALTDREKPLLPTLLHTHFAACRSGAKKVLISS